jgi:hypothetical protein
MTRRSLLLSAATIALAASVALTGCGVTVDLGGRDPGDRITEERSITDVSAVELATTGSLSLSVGDEPSLTITAGENVLDRLTTQITDDTLVIDLPGSWRNPRIDYDLVLPALSSVTLSGSGAVDGDIGGTGVIELRINGSGEIELDEIEASDLTVTIDGSGAVEVDDVVASATDVRVDGSGAVTLDGSTDTLDVAIPGSGDVRLSDLVARDAVVRIDGSGDADVHATRTLDAAIGGSGRITYAGDPDVTRDVDGSGDIEEA